jgi:hypothetical protein
VQKLNNSRWVTPPVSIAYWRHFIAVATITGNEESLAEHSGNSKELVGDTRPVFNFARARPH